ncbi:hypothetical protein D0T84_22400 [Dysgonomonas sp. 521]|nr:hypothetical protein [Dysgonomonas sp. 521]
MFLWPQVACDKQPWPKIPHLASPKGRSRDAGYRQLHISMESIIYPHPLPLPLERAGERWLFHHSISLSPSPFGEGWGEVVHNIRGGDITVLLSSTMLSYLSSLILPAACESSRAEPPRNTPLPASPKRGGSARRSKQLKFKYNKQSLCFPLSSGEGWGEVYYSSFHLSSLLPIWGRPGGGTSISLLLPLLFFNPSPFGHSPSARGESQSGDRYRFARQALFPFDKGKYPKGEGLDR